MTSIYQLLPGKSMPGHHAGDCLYKVEGRDIYQWERAPFYQLEAAQVEQHPDFFVPVVHEWTTGEPLYYLTPVLTVVEQVFQPQHHATLVAAGNAFKRRALAEAFQGRVLAVLHTDTVVLTGEEVRHLRYHAQTGEVVNILQLLNEK